MRSLRTSLITSIPLALFFVLAGAATQAERIPATTDHVDGLAMLDTIDDPSVMEIWNGECKACHGPDGKGQTKAGRRAGSKDFTDPEYQKSWTDSEALQVVKTATKDGKKLKNKDPYGEQFSDEQIKALISYVREFAKGS